MNRRMSSRARHIDTRGTFALLAGWFRPPSGAWNRTTNLRKRQPA
jgi:hypothetical protein